MVGSGEIQVVDSKVEAICNIPEPTNKKLLRSFLGMAGYYRSFIHNYSQIALPLTEMTKNRQTARFLLNDEQRQSFEELKRCLCNAPVLHQLDYDKDFIIQTDASEYAIGGCLAQLDDTGREYPLAFYSAKMTEVQRRWSVIEKESFACIYALKQFDALVFGFNIVLYTDHNPLKYMVDSTLRSAKLTRWALSLQRYSVTVKHKAGKDNLNADCFSRLI